MSYSSISDKKTDIINKIIKFYYPDITFEIEFINDIFIITLYCNYIDINFSYILRLLHSFNLRIMFDVRTEKINYEQTRNNFT